jgi:hypothetical protein
LTYYNRRGFSRLVRNTQKSSVAIIGALKCQEGTRDTFLAKEFPEFVKDKRADGSAKWQKSWCDKTARAMAQESMLKVREDRYELLYRFWSEQLHAAPTAMMPAMFLAFGSNWVRKALYEDDKKIVEVIANSVNIFCEIWQFIPIFRSSFAYCKCREWLNELKALQLKGCKISMNQA